MHRTNLYVIMEEIIIPYELPEVENHSFFFINQRVNTHIEAKLHQHDAWELYYVLHGYGTRMAGDTLQSFSAGDVALIPRLCLIIGNIHPYRQTVMDIFIT